MVKHSRVAGAEGPLAEVLVVIVASVAVRHRTVAGPPAGCPTSEKVKKK